MLAHHVGKEFGRHLVMLFVGQVRNERDRRLVHHADEAIQAFGGELDIARVNLAALGFEQAPDTGTYHGIRDQPEFRPVHGFCGYGSHGILPEHLRVNIQMAPAGNNRISGIVTLNYKLDVRPFWRGLKTPYSRIMLQIVSTRGSRLAARRKERRGLAGISIRAIRTASTRVSQYPRLRP